jgi:L,D-transpeptidase-like protein
MRTAKIRVLAAVALTAFMAPPGRAEGVANCAVGTVNYRLEPGGRASSLMARFNSSQLELLQKLNRVDLDHLARLERIISPDVWVADQLVYSPLPPSFPGSASCSKLIVVYQPAQVFGGYEYGHLVRWGPISSGRQTHQTPTGLFHLNWKSDGRQSTVDPDWFMPWYFNFGNAEGYSFQRVRVAGKAGQPRVRTITRIGRAMAARVGRRMALGRLTPKCSCDRHSGPHCGQLRFQRPAPWRSLAFLARRIELPADPLCQQH